MLGECTDPGERELWEDGALIESSEDEDEDDDAVDSVEGLYGGHGADISRSVPSAIPMREHDVDLLWSKEEGLEQYDNLLCPKGREQMSQMEVACESLCV